MTALRYWSLCEMTCDWMWEQIWQSVLKRLPTQFWKCRPCHVCKSCFFQLRQFRLIHSCLTWTQPGHLFMSLWAVDLTAATACWSQLLTASQGCFKECRVLIYKESYARSYDSAGLISDLRWAYELWAINKNFHKLKLWEISTKLMQNLEKLMTT